MTNSNLVTVFNGSIQSQSVQLANARDLYSFLEIKSAFDNWIKNRITEYGFVQNEDYIIVTERTQGRPRKEYHITLDMGKELAMVERNEKGRQIRKYFIECEKRTLQKSHEIRPLVEPPKTYSVNLTEKELHILSVVMDKYVPMVTEFCDNVEAQQRNVYTALGLPPLQNNPLAARAYSINHEFRYWTNEAKEIIQRINAKKNYALANF